MSESGESHPSLEEWRNKRFSFGKYAGMEYWRVVERHRSYARWALSQTDSSDLLQDFVAFVKASKTHVSVARSTPMHKCTNSQNFMVFSQESVESPDHQASDSKKNLSESCLVFFLVSPTHFTLASQNEKGKLSFYLPLNVYSLVAPFRDVPMQDVNNKRLLFSAVHYSKVLTALKSSEIPFEPVPEFVLIAFKEFRVHLSQTYKISRKSANILTRASSPEITLKIESLANLLGPQLYTALKPFQLEGVIYGLRNHGRCLIGDEMGLGKTLQGLGIAAAFFQEWPCLVISPSSVLFLWRDQVERWLSHLVRPYEVFVVRSGKDVLDATTTKIVICSYDMIKKDQFRLAYNVVICDESHYIKNLTSQRTLKILPLLQQAKRTILLSGTPALNKPTELYSQIYALVPQFSTVKEFSTRYAEVSLNRWTKKPMYSGVIMLEHLCALRLICVTGYRLAEELHLFLKETVMIRRLKRDVQAQLPPKIRTKVPVVCSSEQLKELKMLMSTHTNTFKDTSLKSLLATGPSSDSESYKKTLIPKLFKHTGIGKIKPVIEHLSYLLQNACSKILVFAHHLIVLNELESFFMSLKVSYVRVDGGVSHEDREKRIHKFQNEQSCMIALLSITTCSHGLNLTASSTVVFAELYWVPGVVVQAEDRSHRMGTEHSVINIHYIVAEDTIDELIWNMIEKKWGAITSTLNGKEEDYHTECVAEPYTLPSKQATTFPVSSQQVFHTRSMDSRVVHKKFPTTRLSLHSVPVPKRPSTTEISATNTQTQILKNPDQSKENKKRTHTPSIHNLLKRSNTTEQV